MGRTIRAALAALALLAGCGPALDFPAAPPKEVGREAADAVADRVTGRLAAKSAEVGPAFAESLPAIQDEAAAEAGFEDWEDFLTSLRAWLPGRDLEITREITEEVAALLE